MAHASPERAWPRSRSSPATRARLARPPPQQRLQIDTALMIVKLAYQVFVTTK